MWEIILVLCVCAVTPSNNINDFQLRNDELLCDDGDERGPTHIQHNNPLHRPINESVSEVLHRLQFSLSLKSVSQMDIFCNPNLNRHILTQTTRDLCVISSRNRSGIVVADHQTHLETTLSTKNPSPPYPQQSRGCARVKMRTPGLCCFTPNYNNKRNSYHKTRQT